MGEKGGWPLLGDVREKRIDHPNGEWDLTGTKGTRERSKGGVMSAGGWGGIVIPQRSSRKEGDGLPNQGGEKEKRSGKYFLFLTTICKATGLCQENKGCIALKAN